MKKFIQIFVFANALFFAPVVSAQVLIEQGKVELTAVPGQTLTGSVSVHNTTESPVSVRAYLADFIYVDPFNGKKDFLPPGSTEYSMADWFSFLPRNLTLQPFEKKEIKYSIQVPTNADGGYYNVLFVERDAGRVAGGAMAGVQIISRVGSLFFVETVNTRPRGKIEGLQTSEEGLTFRLTNTGKVIVIPESTYFIMNQDGRAVERGDAKAVYLPPQKTANLSVPFGKELEDGAYTLVLTVDLGEGEALIREVDFRKQGNNVEIRKIRE